MDRDGGGGVSLAELRAELRLREASHLPGTDDMRRIGVRAEDCRAYEDGESGLISAYLAGCHVIDVTMADEYPSCECLRAAKKIALAEREWVK